VEIGLANSTAGKQDWEGEQKARVGAPGIKHVWHTCKQHGVWHKHTHTHEQLSHGHKNYISMTIMLRACMAWHTCNSGACDVGSKLRHQALCRGGLIVQHKPGCGAACTPSSVLGSITRGASPICMTPTHQRCVSHMHDSHPPEVRLPNAWFPLTRGAPPSAACGGAWTACGQCMEYNEDSRSLCDSVGCGI